MTDADKTDPYDLQRFIDAQSAVFETVCEELGRGCKKSHWMWFVFPQIKGLGHSPLSRRYAISCREEAAAYLHHPILGPRLRRCTHLVNVTEGRSFGQIFGSPDDLKFHSSMTLFAHTAADNQIFQEALDRYFGGVFDQATLERL